MFEFTHTNQKEQEPKKEVIGPLAPPTYRGTLFQKAEAPEKDKPDQAHPLFVKAAKGSQQVMKEDDKDEDYEDVRPATKKGAHKGLLVHFESRCQTKMFIPTRLSELETSQIEVVVEDGLMQTSKALFTTTHYLSFKIRIPQLKTEVRRQDEDFDLLMKYLTSEYPHLIVPIIKPSKAQKQFAGKYINKRGVMLARFLRAILRNRILRGDQFLMHFLTEPNED